MESNVAKSGCMADGHSGSVPLRSFDASPGNSTVVEVHDQASDGASVFDEETMFGTTMETAPAPSTMVDVPRKEKHHFEICQAVFVKTNSEHGHYWYPGLIVGIGLSDWKQQDAHPVITAVSYNIKYTYQVGDELRFYEGDEECLFAENILPDTVNVRERVYRENKTFEIALEEKKQKDSEKAVKDRKRLQEKDRTKYKKRKIATCTACTGIIPEKST